MSAPKRIQRKRTKGWRMPEGALYVGRPSRWGNPYRLDRLSAFEYVALNADGTEIPDSWGGRDFAAEYAVDLYREALRIFEPDEDDFWTPLVGHNLVCWCPLDQPCHADVLLEVANRDTTTCRACGTDYPGPGGCPECGREGATC